MNEQDRPRDEEQQESGAADATDANAPAAETASDAADREAAGEGGEPLARAEAEVARLTDALARKQAEMVNHEKRLEREMDKARKFALERLMRDFVQVLDSLDQAIAASGGGDGDAAIEGLALTRKLALKVLESHGLETIDPEGQAFDANWHEAMTATPTDEAEPDTVLQVLQTGYALHGRLLRPARVIVARAP